MASLPPCSPSRVSRLARTIILLAALAPALAVAGASAAAEPARPLAGRVVRLIDGDTIHVDLGDRVEKVRYIGIDAPELRHPARGLEPGAREAAEVNRQLVYGKRVRLEPDVQTRDRYGRLLAYVWVHQAYGSEIMINAELVRQGYAHASTVPPNVRYSRMFALLEREARASHRGLWNRATRGSSEATEPSDRVPQGYR